MSMYCLSVSRWFVNFNYLKYIIQNIILLTIIYMILLGGIVKIIQN